MTVPFSWSRLCSVVALGALVLVLTACNPGRAASRLLVGSTSAGNVQHPNDRLILRADCTANGSTVGNCAGSIHALIDGSVFESGTRFPGYFSNVSISPSGNYDTYDCATGTTCTHSGYFCLGGCGPNVVGQGRYGGQPVTFTATGGDADPAEDGVTLNSGVSISDYATLSIYSTSGAFIANRTFTCTDNCIEVVNYPIPAGYKVP